MYAAAAATPVASLPTALPSDGVARFRLGGGTTTFADDSGVSVLWGGATPKVGVSIRTNVEMLPGLIYEVAPSNYSLRTTGGLEDPRNSEVGFLPGTATFSGTNVPATCTNFSSCRGTVQGFIAGPNAERALVGYLVEDTTPTGIPPRAETAIFIRDAAAPLPTASSATPPVVPPTPPTPPVVLPTPPAPPTPAFTPLDMTVGGINMVSGGSDGFPFQRRTGINAITQNASGVLTSYDRLGDVYVINSAQGMEAGGDTLITWGRWTNGTPQLLSTGGGPVNQPTIGAEQGWHYLIGKPTPTLPATGTANFTLLGVTKPTFGDGSAAFPAGTLTSTGAIPMAVEWGGNAGTRIGLDLTVTMPNDGAYRLQTTGGVATPSTSELSTGGSALFSSMSVPVTTTGGARACMGGTCTGMVNGFFAGPNAERAGVGYKIGDGNTFTTRGILGAAALTR